LIDLVVLDSRHGKGERAAADLLRKRFALKACELLRIVDSAGHALRVENDRRRYDWSRERTAADFVGPGDYLVPALE